ncbi:hypothetical protein [Luteococcus peritonei]|uniref:DUF2207 domain-containing protein n=1 Tax=Luteococcus peritonei TaxID=88874 RepID=A0ABW4RSU4_9ACTN
MSTDLSHVTQDFTAIAGRAEDHAWAGTALLTLLQGRLAPETVARRLEQARRLVAESGESAEDVLGEPVPWAREQLAEASLAGASFTDDESTPHDVVVVGLLLAVVMTLVWGVLSLVKGHWSTDWNLAMVMAPPLLAGLVVGAITTHERLLRRRPQWQATALTALACTPPVLLLAWFLVAHPVSLGRHSSLWWFALAGLLAALTWLAGRLVPDPGQRRVATVGLDDEQWLAQARVRLRERGGLREEQIVAILDEARAHSRQAGTSLAAEFGNPVGYAGTLPVDEARTARNRCVVWLLLAVLWGGLALAEPTGWRVGMALVTGLVAALSWWQHLRRPRPETQR